MAVDTVDEFEAELKKVQGWGCRAVRCWVVIVCRRVVHLGSCCRDCVCSWWWRVPGKQAAVVSSPSIPPPRPLFPWPTPPSYPPAPSPAPPLLQPQAGHKLVVLEVHSDTVCQTGFEEEAELHWKADQQAALEPCRTLKHTFQRTARDCPDVVFLEHLVRRRPEGWREHLEGAGEGQ